ncbi:hypothetical protein CkaCkLH20_10351 [Colletotrichum karsti]|uniref:Uncharacterized protein n=1 Tax=Colletotrichum karsti TaxID=1095194 RepID=A0A9P6HXK4_9PEZI|nr:uncharacterized protein CkaCkLH20_10351 [Colletotrichum karsti]KAF9872259.1 hypothetical protein CkaCkLH20_10351 [Colletotrichum karsti]
MPWIPTLNKAGALFSAFPAGWATTFSCIVQLESGSLDVSPDACKKVMALSVGDSLYVAVPLLCDPIEEPSPYEVRRIRGNVGTPGIAMLIPPAQLEPPEYDMNTWNIINHEPYDGRQEDSFQATSLHMSFTGFTLPVDLRTRGLRDTELYYMETRVTVHDHGAEISDLDILGSLENKNFRRIPACQHDKSFSRGPNKAVAHNSMLTMVDNWFELLDDPERAAVARSSGNWLGRLSLAVVGLQLGYHVIIVPHDFCWPCIQDYWKYVRFRNSTVSFDTVHVQSLASRGPTKNVPNARWAAFNDVDPLAVSEKEALKESSGDDAASVDAINPYIRDLYAPLETPSEESQPIGETLRMMQDRAQSAETKAQKSTDTSDDSEQMLKEMGEGRVIIIC